MNTAEQIERRDQIERRLQKLREERARDQLAVPGSTHVNSGDASELTLVASDPEVLRVGSSSLRVGDQVKVRDDAVTLERADAVLPRADKTKLVYLGEKGTVNCVLHEFYGKPGVELKFADDAVKFFFAECLDFGGPRPTSETKSRGTTVHSDPATVADSMRDENRTASASSVQVPPPSWSQLRNPKETKPIVLVAKTDLPQQASVSHQPVQSAPSDETLTTPAPAFSGTSPAPREAVTPTPSDNAMSLARPRVTGYMALKSLDDDDNLLKTPRNEAPPSWAKPTSLLSGSDQVHLPSRVSKGDPASSIPSSCPPTYVGKFPFPDPNSSITVLKKQQERVAVKRCTLIDKDTLLAPHKDSDFRGIALREQLHDSWDSILSACTKELGWTGQERRVTRLFTLSGQEILWPDAIREGMCLVATAGELYVMPSKTQNTRTVVAPILLPGRRSNSPFSKPVGLLSKVPAALPVPARTVSPSRMILPQQQVTAKPITLRVFSNGEYGDVVSERTPFRSVTIRPTHKTLASVLTTIARELQWHSLGRKCEVLYTAHGGEITSISQISDGDSVVASSGDRFVVPRSNTVLHADVLRSAVTVPSAGLSRPRSPLGARAKSPSAAPGSAVKASSAMLRAKQLGEEIQRIDLKATRLR